MELQTEDLNSIAAAHHILAASRMDCGRYPVGRAAYLPSFGDDSRHASGSHARGPSGGRARVLLCAYR